jgi:hypothetical protein
MPALAAALRAEAVIAEFVVQVFADQRRVVEAFAVLDDERGDTW